MTKKINKLDKNPENGDQSWTENEVIKSQIELQDIMTLVDKLGVSGKQIFLHTLSEQENLSENVFKLLINQADSKILCNLCANAQVSWKILDVLVQKLIGISQGKEKVPVYAPDKNENHDDLDDDEYVQERRTPAFVGQIGSFLEFIFKNHNLSSKQIEDSMKNYRGSMSYRFQCNLCSNPHTPSQILEKMYEINPEDMKDMVLCHPNLSKGFVETINTKKEQENEKNKNTNEIKNLLKKHPNLDIYQVLAYYENKEDKEICKKIAEYLYNYNLWNVSFGEKRHDENLPLKLHLAQKYDMWQERILRILYDMLWDNIVDNGSLEIYQGCDNKPKYLTIEEIETKYGIKIEQERIKKVYQNILKSMQNWYKPSFDKVENIYQFAKKNEMELPEVVQKFYIKALINVIKEKKNDGWYMQIFESRQYFYTSWQLLLQYKHLFSEKELEEYILTMNKRLSFPLVGIDDMLEYIKEEYSRTTKLWDTAKQDGFKEVKSLEWMDIYDLTQKLWLSDTFLHKIILQKLKDCLSYFYDDGRKLMQRFTIDKKELIALIINRKEIDSDMGEEDTCNRRFSMEWQYSLDECLREYGISPEEVIPSLMWDIKNELISHIQRKDYNDAKKLVEKYNLSDNPDFQEYIETLNILTTNK